MSRPCLKIELSYEKSPGREMKWEKTIRGSTRQCKADRIKNNLIKCTQEITIKDSVDRDR